MRWDRFFPPAPTLAPAPAPAFVGVNLFDSFAALSVPALPAEVKKSVAAAPSYAPAPAPAASAAPSHKKVEIRS